MPGEDDTGRESRALPIRPGDVIAEKYLVIRIVASGGKG